jgi:CheY-like chemotaxis protein
VDDELFVLEVARRILEGYGYDVVTAENGRQGLEIFRQEARISLWSCLTRPCPIWMAKKPIAP